MNDIEHVLRSRLALIDFQEPVRNDLLPELRTRYRRGRLTRAGVSAMVAVVLLVAAPILATGVGFSHGHQHDTGITRPFAPPGRGVALEVRAARPPAWMQRGILGIDKVNDAKMYELTGGPYFAVADGTASRLGGMGRLRGQHVRMIIDFGKNPYGSTWPGGGGTAAEAPNWPMYLSLDWNSSGQLLFLWPGLPQDAVAVKYVTDGRVLASSNVLNGVGGIRVKPWMDAAGQPGTFVAVNKQNQIVQTWTPPKVP